MYEISKISVRLAYITQYNIIMYKSHTLEINAMGLPHYSQNCFVSKTILWWEVINIITSISIIFPKLYCECDINAVQGLKYVRALGMWSQWSDLYDILCSVDWMLLTSDGVVLYTIDDN